MASYPAPSLGAVQGAAESVGEQTEWAWTLAVRGADSFPRVLEAGSVSFRSWGRWVVAVTPDRAETPWGF